MSKLYNGGPAFPAGRICIDGVEQDANGMSLRAWLAGQALAGILATYANPDSGGACWSLETLKDELPTKERKMVAANCVAYADAMLAELEKE